MINVVQLLHSRTEYLDRQLTCMKNQVVDDKITYHLILNNPNLHDKHTEIIENKNLDFVKVSYADNSKICFERFHYIKNNLLNNEFVIIMDDDQFISSDQVKELWNLRKKKTFVTWHGTVFTKDRIDMYTDWKYSFDHNHNPNNKKYSYGGPNFCVIDTEIFQPNSDLFFIEDMYPKSCRSMDDITLSWICSKINWTIERSFVRPEIHIQRDSNSIACKLDGKKLKKYFVELLDSIHPFVRYEEDN